ncbi:efflux RND transporter periplasmic adaptor subunit [Hymenobacter crusticola]|uniref:Efflux transporter periplasmic adaptor subunit n=1 Tax=Hymenobacter crusticola TaxID=1770526 RepID=A0A243WFU6_9BACT|nr:efflux RND transporter periplasmic adaptor subunit [Hymenobacter crusticola]OUJ74646.1 efflux transporter periplasmic adaptor subunit [Hymenobacter crusticola]
MPLPRFSQLAWVVVSLFGVTLAGCAEKSQADTQKTAAAPALPVTELVASDTVLHHDYVADIQSVRNVELRARVPGFLEQIYVDEGQAVKKGQLLFRINDAEFRSQVAKAKAAYNNAQAQARVIQLELDRVKMLVDKDIISPSELAVAQSKLKAAQASVAEAQSLRNTAALNVSYTMVRAPFDGLVDRMPLKAGSLIADGTLLTTVSDAGAVYAYFNVAEKEYLEYAKSRQQNGTRPGSLDVSLLLADGTPYSYPGKIQTQESEFDESTGSIAFRAQFPNPDKLLKHGATGRVRLTNPIHNVVLVPQKAVFEIQDKNYVFVVDSANKVKMQAFVPQTRLSDFYVVKSGLKPGQKIVYEGVQDLREGTKIQPRYVTMDDLLADAR